MNAATHRPRIVASDAELRAARAAVEASGGLVLRLRGRRMRTDDGLFTEFARKLDFPAWFGHNWAALEDCLIDLEWLPAPGYLLVVDDAEQVLVEEELPRVGLFGDLLTRVTEAWSQPVADGQWWDREGLEFRIVLHPGTLALADELQARWSAAGVPLDNHPPPPSP